MNTSMADTYNLGWKLGSVLNGWITRSALTTYESERRKVAQDLIAFDYKLSRAFSGAPGAENMFDLFEKYGAFMEGFGIHYAASILAAGVDADVAASPQYHIRGEPIISKDWEIVQAEPSFATNVAVGSHFPSAPVLVQAESRPDQLQRLLQSDGRWRVIVFAGDISNDVAWARLNALGDQLARITERYVVRRPRRGARHAPGAMRRESLVDVLTVHCAPLLARELHDFHPAFFPPDEVEGFEYEKILLDADMSRWEHLCVGPIKGSGHAYEAYGVDRVKGALVLVRPDQYTAFVGGLEDVSGLDRFLSQALMEQR